MKPFMQYCTLTGADDKTPIDELKRLSKEYPFIEWGILRSPSKIGQARYPTTEWISSFWNAGIDANICFHLCGKAVTDFLTSGGISIFEDDLWWMKPDRYQLNFNAIKSKMNPEDLRIKSFHNVILQLNKSNASFISKLESDLQFHLLYDASGGRGTSISTINSPVPGFFTGYAGGINPENVEEILDEIVETIGGFGRYWIDMESGIRTNDEFDINKAVQVLEVAKKYAKL